MSTRRPFDWAESYPAVAGYLLLAFALAFARTEGWLDDGHVQHPRPNSPHSAPFAVPGGVPPVELTPFRSTLAPPATPAGGALSTPDAR